MAHLQLKKLVKKYPNGFEAVHGIDLDVKDGEFMVLVGPSGCAKSTTLRMIAGLESVTAGEIRIGERVVNTLVPGRRGIAMVFQNYALYPHMKVRKNLSFGLRLAGRPKDEIEAATKEVAEILEIEALLDRLPKELSGGQAQRVALGRALIKKPEVFLFDEPLSNLDAKLRASMRVRITDLHRRLKEEGRPATVIYVTHDQTEAMTMGDRICVMKEGHIMQVADPVTLYDKPENAFVAGFIGTPEMNLMNAQLSIAGSHTLKIGNQTISLADELASRIKASADDSEVILGIRPQHFHLAPEGTADTLSGEVTALEFMGHEVYLHVNVEGNSLIAVIPGEEYDPTNVRGSKVCLKVNESRAHVFDRESGKNISFT
ncbi:sn-glycerol-3-phosphate ABC transporter ATP-binding protein UgpC [uncultured Cohaesibacter sp.]|uniref:ABC transporter ATP-binding protein n=1 Tax=uncultured Cohaesibacter sp. TaxID=1002546 RepID=UPI00292FC72A|nr:sn-glycerol-3-phosphate ABC transporter ATP-binding protein UgpC [uncultured Cohaesibacter sp.]